MAYAITVNGTGHAADYKPDMPLVWVLRDLLARGAVMTGCGRGNCGACTVRLNGESIHSCSVTIAAADGGVVTTLAYRPAVFEGRGVPERAGLGVALAALMVLAPLAAQAQEGSPRTDLPFTPNGARGAYNGRGGSTKEGPGETSPYKSAAEHYAALKAKAKAAGGGRMLKPAELPDWSGVWNIDGGFVNFDPSLARDATHYGPLSAGNQAFYNKTLSDLEKGVEWDALSYCLPAGYPRWISEPFLRDFGVTPTVTYLINEQQSEVRRVYTDGRGHRPDDEAIPLWEGDAIGFWDGTGDSATLVFWTSNLHQGVYHRNGPRYSEKAETIEVMRKVDATHIKVDLTIYDPVDLTRPWTVHRGYVKDRLPNGRIDMWSCEENNNVVKTDAGGSDFVLPGEAGYKDPGKRGDPSAQQGK